MWYEIEMVDEYLNSLAGALQRATWPVRLHFMLNAQTYLELPDEGHSAMELATQIQQKILHFNFKIPATTYSISIDYRTDDDPFYNIGDYRREYKNEEDGFTIWGETDSLYPTTYFKVLEMVGAGPNDNPFIVTFASRKCWDDTWKIVEHVFFQQLPVTGKDEKMLKPPYNFDDYITQEQLNYFNDELNTKTPPLLQLHGWKFDGSLMAFSSGMPQIIPDDMHFAREDWCAQIVIEFVYPEIKQLHFPTILKGHNYNHPKKRMYTSVTRDDTAYKLAERQSILAGKRWLNNFGIEFVPDGPNIRVTRNV